MQRAARPPRAKRRSLRFPANPGNEALHAAMKPPLLPSEMLRRVLRVARFDGVSCSSSPGGFALISAASRDVSRRGDRAPRRGRRRDRAPRGGAAAGRSTRSGMRWLIWSQLYLMASS